MRNPRKVKIIIFGLKKKDEQKYFRNKHVYIKEEKPKDFPLDQIRQSYGIRVQRFQNYVQIKCPLEGLNIHVQYQPFLYNHNKKRFYDMQELVNDGYIILNKEYCDEENPLLIRLTFIFDKYKIQNEIRQIKQKIGQLKKQIIKLDNEVDHQKELKLELYQEINQIIKKNKTTYDIAILYSNPMNVEQKPVGFNKEIDNFLSVIKGKQISYYITQATQENLRRVLRQNPKIIHIMSHGGRDDKQQKQLNFEKKIHQDKDFQTYLNFEKKIDDDDAFIVDQVKEEHIDEIFKYSYKRALLFFSCCHSGQIAQIFQDAGYSTIAIEPLLKLWEETAIHYFQYFYEKLIQKEKLTFQQCHEEAKKKVKTKFQEKNLIDYLDCDSHQHRVQCKNLFNDENRKTIQKIYQQQPKCCCQQKMDVLIHQWDDKCIVKNNFKQLLQKLSDEEQINVLLKLDQVAEIKKELKLCCCELAEIINNQEDIKDYLKSPIVQIEHQASETLKFFGDNQLRIFNFIEFGKETEINKNQWEIEYWPLWTLFPSRVEFFQKMRDDLKKIYKKEQTENIIIVRCEPNKKKKHSNFILKFIEYIAKYFTKRYIDQSTLNDIKTQIQIIQDIKEIDKYTDSEQIKYLFITEKDDIKWEQFKNLQVHIIIVIYCEKEKIQDYDKLVYLRWDDVLSKQVQKIEEEIKKEMGEQQQN